MKNLIALSILLISLSLSGQDVNTKLTKGGSFTGLGRQGDTLTASTTVDYVLELGNDTFGLMTIGVESDSVSGTSAYDSYIYKSNNGKDWGAPIDTVTHTGGGDDYTEFDVVNGTSTYYKVSTVATSATQKSNITIWGRLNEGFVIEN